MFVSNEGNITVGSPLVSDAVVVAEVLEHGKGRKVINFKYKAKVRYRRKRGHRQGYTRLSIEEIRLGGTVVLNPRKRPTVGATQTPTPSAAIEAETPVAEAPSETPAPAARRRRAPAASQEPTAAAEETTPEAEEKKTEE